MADFMEVRQELNKQIRANETAIANSEQILQRLSILTDNHRRLVLRIGLLMEAFEKKDLTRYKQPTHQMRMLCYAVGIDYLWEGNEELIEKEVMYNDK